MTDRILVTGGAGFVGSHAAAYYDEQDAEVTVIDNLSRSETLPTASSSDKQNWQYLRREHPNVDLVRGDIRDQKELAEVVAGCDAVIHTAGQVAVTSSLEDPEHDFEVNARGTLNVLEVIAAAESDPALVFASTNKVYGNNVNAIPVRELKSRYEFDDQQYARGVPETLSVDDTEHTPYGVSKLAADLYVQDYARRGVIDAAVFRMSCIYGERQLGCEDQGWVAHFIRSVLEESPITIYGDGKQIRDVLHISDLIRAYDAFLSNPSEKPTVYNIGGGPTQTTSLLELIDLLEETVGRRPELSFEGWREGDQKVYISDISRATEHLEWEPEVSLADGVDRFIKWYEASEL